MNSRDPDALIARAGRGDPAFDQHFLVDDRVLERIPTYAPAHAMDCVLEIGPGTGALTDHLLSHADHVVAVERDPDLAAFLREEFSAEIAAGALDVIEGDALEVEFPEFTCSVSNLPYGLSSPIAFELLRHPVPLVLMFQEEFAERMVAEPETPEYGRLSVAAQHFGELEVVETVPASAFDPEPRVESAVVRVTPRVDAYDLPEWVPETGYQALFDDGVGPQPGETELEALFLDVLKAVFTQRRKTLRNAIRNTTQISQLEHTDTLLEALPTRLLDRRPGAVRPAEFAALARLADAIEAGEQP